METRVHLPRAGVHERAVAQFGSASALGAECRRFKSCQPDKKPGVPMVLPLGIPGFNDCAHKRNSDATHVVVGAQIIHSMQDLVCVDQRSDDDQRAENAP